MDGFYTSGGVIPPDSYFDAPLRVRCFKYWHRNVSGDDTELRLSSFILVQDLKLTDAQEEEKPICEYF